MINIAHIHPMLVHFPIVLFMTAVLIDGYVMLHKGDLGGQSCLVITGFSALAIGMVFALVAAFFGVLTLAQGFSLWRKREIKNALGWVFVAVGLLGLVVLLSTAYHGGNLVYDMGVNVTGVKP